MKELDLRKKLEPRKGRNEKNDKVKEGAEERTGGKDRKNVTKGRVRSESNRLRLK
jgi:hypothetical protein